MTWLQAGGSHDLLLLQIQLFAQVAHKALVNIISISLLEAMT